MNARFVQFFLALILTTVCLSVSAGSYDTKIAAETSNNKVKEIAFVDAGIKNSDSLLREIDPNIDIVFIDSQRDGVEQIAETLATRKDIKAIHILSHGRSGILDLGATKLSATSIQGNHADEMTVIRGALSQNADILIYGCNFAQDASGTRAVELLAAATGADVVASDNLTGAVALGGDWVMEVQSGVIETAQINAKSWDGVMAPFIISTTANPATSGGTGIGAKALWVGAGTVGGTTIDLQATVISGTGVVDVEFLFTGNDPRIRMKNIAEMTVLWEAFETGTGQAVAIAGDPTFLIQDLDGDGDPLGETVESVAAGLTGLTSYTVETPTNIVVSNINSTIRATGTQPQDLLTEKDGWISYSWTGVSSWEVTYVSYQISNHDFIQDGNGELSFSSPNVVLAGPAPPSVAISGAPVSTNSTPFGITITFSEVVTGFIADEITAVNATVSGFAGSGAVYAATVTPTGGPISLDVNAAVATDTSGNANTAATTINVAYDVIAPTVEISGAPTTTNNTPFGITVTFSETVTGFVVGDISVGNGFAGTFVAVDGNTYTADITPDGNGDITIDVAAGVAQDAAINANTAAVQAVVSFDNDADNDGIPDNIECPAGLPHTVPNCPDTDGDTIPDVLDTDSDNDGLLDAEEDANSNGVVDFGESNPLDSDSDDDGLSDGYEVNILASDPTSQTTVYTSQVNPGDMNGDGDINVGDLLLLQQEILNP